MRTSTVVVAVGLVLIVCSAVAKISPLSKHRPGHLVFTEPLISHVCKEPKRGAPSENEKVRFAFHNAGDQPVRILTVQSGCGCTVADVQPGVVKGGANGFVEATFAPLDTGARDVSIVLRTDSKVESESNLTLRMVSGRRPPYVADLEGSVLYRDGDLSEIPKTFKIRTFELGGVPKPPTVSCSLDNLKVVYNDYGETTEANTKWIKREYSYLLLFPYGPPMEDFSGSIKVVSPWDSDDVRTVAVAGWPIPAVSTDPKRLVFSLVKSGDTPCETEFVVKTKQPVVVFEAKVSHPDSALSVELLEVSADHRSARFKVTQVSAEAMTVRPLEQIDIKVRREDNSVLTHKLFVKLDGA